MPFDNIVKTLSSQQVQRLSQTPQGLVDRGVLGVTRGIGLQLVVPVIVDAGKLGSLTGLKCLQHVAVCKTIPDRKSSLSRSLMSSAHRKEKPAGPRK